MLRKIRVMWKIGVVVMMYSNVASPMLWIVRCGCSPHLYPLTFQSSHRISSKWTRPHESNETGLLFHLVQWKRTNNMADKFVFPQNQVNLAKSTFSKAHCKEPSGEMRNGHALTHQYSMPYPPPRPPLLLLTTRAELCVTGREMSLSDPHRWTHLSACQVGVS